MVEQGSYFLLLEDKNAIWQSTENHVALTAKIMKSSVFMGWNYKMMLVSQGR